MRGEVNLSRNRGGRLVLRTVAVAVTSALGIFGAAAPAVAHWEPANTVDNSGTGFTATYPKNAVAAGPTGSATALFFQATPSTPAGQPGNAFSIRRGPEAAAWGAPAPVSTPAGKVSAFADPSMAASKDGTTIGAFVFDDPGNVAQVLATRWPFAAGAPGAASQILCTSGTTPQCAKGVPQVAFDGAGIGHAVGSTVLGLTGSVLYARTDSSGVWQPAEVVASGGNPQLAVNSGGDVVVDYVRSAVVPPSINVNRVWAKRRLSSDTGFGAEQQISGPNAVDITGTPVVIDGAGDATFLFSEDTLPPSGGPPSAPVLQAVRWLRSNAAHSPPEQLTTSSEGTARAAVAAVDPVGRVTAVWTQFSGQSAVLAAEHTAAGWSAPDPVSPAGSDRNATTPQVAVDASGIATVSYTDSAPPTGGDVDVKASRRATGGTWTAPESLRSDAAGAGAVQATHHVAAARAGTADVIFMQQLNGTNRLFATRFNHSAYVRPKGATPLRVPLVPAFRQCTAPDETHGPPLAFPSCSSPAQRSSTVTVGTNDANGNAANSAGFVRLVVVPGNPGTPANEADVLMSVSITDVRKASDRSDYTGELQAVASARLTDREEAPTEDEPSTIEDTGFGTTVPCAATVSTTIGATCSTETSFNAIVPGAAAEGTRAVWQLGQMQVFDGGADGDVDTAPNALFAVQGVFVP